MSLLSKGLDLAKKGFNMAKPGLVFLGVTLVAGYLSGGIPAVAPVSPLLSATLGAVGTMKWQRSKQEREEKKQLKERESNIVKAQEAAEYYGDREPIKELENNREKGKLATNKADREFLMSCEAVGAFVAANLATMATFAHYGLFESTVQAGAAMPTGSLPFYVGSAVPGILATAGYYFIEARKEEKLERAIFDKETVLNFAEQGLIKEYGINERDSRDTQGKGNIEKGTSMEEINRSLAEEKSEEQGAGSQPVTAKEIEVKEPEFGSK